MLYFVFDSYLERFRKQRKDTSKNIPWKKVEWFPKSGNEGLYGWTYLQADRIHLREDLGEKQEEVDVHESIHTNDEYETRVLTSWILGVKREQKYGREIPEYIR